MIGWGELILIILIALILLGPEKLSEIARELGKLYGEYKKAKRKFELEVIYGVSLSDENPEEIIKKKHKEIAEELFHIK